MESFLFVVCGFKCPSVKVWATYFLCIVQNLCEFSDQKHQSLSPVGLTPRPQHPTIHVGPSCVEELPILKVNRVNTLNVHPFKIRMAKAYLTILLVEVLRDSPRNIAL